MQEKHKRRCANLGYRAGRRCVGVVTRFYVQRIIDSGSVWAMYSDIVDSLCIMALQARLLVSDSVFHAMEL